MQTGFLGRRGRSRFQQRALNDDHSDSKSMFWLLAASGPSDFIQAKGAMSIVCSAFVTSIRNCCNSQQHRASG